MIFSETKIRLKDNSGAIWAKCVKVLNCSQKKGLPPMGSAILSIRKVRYNKNKIEKGKMYKGVLIRRKKEYNRRNGDTIAFDNNSFILLNERNLPIASRIKGPLYKEFRSKYMTKVIILSNLSI